MFKLAKCCMLSVLALSFSNQAADVATTDLKPQKFPIAPFTAEYNIIHKGSPVGTAVRELNYLADGKIHYSYNTEIEWLIFSDHRKESSVLSFNNNHVIPNHYLFERSGTGKDKRSEWKFIPEKNQAFVMEEDEDDHQIELDFSTQIQDKLSYHLQQRLDLIENPKQKHFVFEVIQSSGRTKNYVYEFDAEEELMLPYGSIKTIRLKREVVEKQRITYAWFAPELNYLLVRLNQIKGDVNQFEAQLDKYSLSPITAKK